MDTNVTVRCTINNCHYWVEGKGCAASEILIAHDAMASEEGESVDAPMVDELENTPADKCMETCCKTFMSRDSGRRRQDDVSRR